MQQGAPAPPAGPLPLLPGADKARGSVLLRVRGEAGLAAEGGLWWEGSEEGRMCGGGGSCLAGGEGGGVWGCKKKQVALLRVRPQK